MPAFDVLIIGSGLGGLTLGQSLRNAGVGVRIFERDSGPWDRPQGYRLHLDADALNAAHEVLPADLRAVFDATSQRTAPFTTILGKDLGVVKRLLTGDEHDAQLWPGHHGEPTHRNVDRAVLRKILLTGLEDVIRPATSGSFATRAGKTVSSHTSPTGPPPRGASSSGPTASARWCDRSARRTPRRWRRASSPSMAACRSSRVARSCRRRRCATSSPSPATSGRCSSGSARCAFPRRRIRPARRSRRGPS